MTSQVPSVEIAVPVYNEAAILAQSIERLHEFLSEEFPFDWSIVIVDNGSTDATVAIARELTESLDRVSVIALQEKGRGLALRNAWLASDADIVAYMDVDLSTDLRSLLPLVAPLVSGHSEIAIGSRLSKSSQVERGALREFISRSYNLILRTVLRARFRDAQCGFKAVRAETARQLIPEIRDNTWFFDTELLVLAQRKGLPIFEVPVKWIDDPDSRVNIVSTALDDLAGVARLAYADSVYRFIAVGVLSTIAYALIYVALRNVLSPGLSNAIALGITAVANTGVNRSFTFGLRGRHSLVRDYTMGAGVFILTLLITSVALFVLNAVDPHPNRLTEVIVLVAASVCATFVRYVALRFWVFERAHKAPLEGVDLALPTLPAAPPAAHRSS